VAAAGFMGPAAAFSKESAAARSSFPRCADAAPAVSSLAAGGRFSIGGLDD